MNMTHYMELLAVNQPWNLILFMAIPVILAETLAITELYLLLRDTLKARFILSIAFLGLQSASILLASLFTLLRMQLFPLLKQANGEQ